MVIGSCPPDPVEPTLAAQAAALWWMDHYRAKREAAALMFVDVLSGNASLPTELFTRMGGFDEAFAVHRREDWDFGVRVLRAGVAAVHAPEAVATHEFHLTTRGAIAAAAREGAGDALLLARWPEVAATLPPGAGPTRRVAPRAAVRALLGRPAAQRQALRVLDVLERLKARGPWLRAFDVTRQAAYAHERRAATARLGATAAPRQRTLAVDLADPRPIPAPAVAAPAIEVRWRSRPLGVVRPVDGQWSAPQLAFQMLDLARPDVWAEMAAGLRPPAASRTPGPEPVHETVIAPPWDDTGAWRALDERLRGSEAEVVVVTLRRRSVFRLPRGALDAFASPRVGLVFGGVSEDRLLGPASVYSEEVPYWGDTLPCGRVEYVAVRPGVLRAVGGLDTWAVPFGAQVLAQDLADRVLAAGHHVAQQDLPLAEKAPPGFRATWRRDRGAGALAARRLAAAGPRAGLREFLRSVPWSRRPHSLAFHGAGFASGAAAVLRGPHARRT